MKETFLKVAVPAPLRRHYVYLVGENFRQLEFLPGMRVSVPFGRRREQVGIALGVVDRTSLRPEQLKSVTNVIDHQPLFSSRHFDLLQWAADYYQHPVGEALFAALPGLLRQGKPLERGYDEIFSASAEGREVDAGLNAPAQQSLLQLFRSCPGGLTRRELRASYSRYARPLQALIEKGWCYGPGRNGRARRARGRDGGARVCIEPPANRSGQLHHERHQPRTAPTYCRELPAAARRKSISKPSGA